MANTVSEYDGATKTLYLTRTAPTSEAHRNPLDAPLTGLIHLLFYGTVAINLLSPVLVKLNLQSSCPIDVQITLVGPDTAA